MGSTLRVAAVQMRSSSNREENLDAARRLMEEAVSRGADLIALPENFSFLDADGRKLEVVEEVDTGESVRFLSTYAAEHKVGLVGGSVPLKANDATKVRNSCLVFDPSGTLVARYDKAHLFDIGLDRETTFSESRHVEPGSELVVVDMLGHRLGLSVCYDLRFPELYRALSRKGAEILFIPSAFTLQTGRDHWSTLLRARAIENLCYVVAPAQQGRHSDNRVTYGRSMIVGPWGQVLGQVQDGEGLVVCDLDFEYLEDVRRRLPCLDHRREDLFREGLSGSE